MHKDGASRWKWKTCKEFPADYSYFNITSLTEGGLPGRSRHSRLSPEPSRDSSGRYAASRVLLSKNALSCLEGLFAFLERRVQRPLLVKWLDLSCNQIAQLDTDLFKLRGLEIIYLHSNCLDFDEVFKLSNLKSLKILTLYGNPIEVQTDYRLRVIAYLPGLRRLDFSSVTQKETFMARPYCPKRKKEEAVADQAKVGEAEVKATSGAAVGEVMADNENEEAEDPGSIENGEEEEGEEVGEENWTSEGSSEIVGTPKKEYSEPKEIPIQIAKGTEREKKYVEKIYQKLKEVEKGYKFNYFDGPD